MTTQYLQEKGFNEGLLDSLFVNPFNTVEDRAWHAFTKMGFRTHYRSFLAGYKKSVNSENKPALTYTGSQIKQKGVKDEGNESEIS